MTTSTITAPAATVVPSRRAMTALLVLVALVAGAVIGASAGSWWQSRQLEATTAAAAPVAVTRPALDPATYHYGARAADLEATLAVTGAPALVAAVDPEQRYYGRTRLVRPSSPDVASPVAAAQVRTPETHIYGTRSGS